MAESVDKRRPSCCGRVATGILVLVGLLLIVLLGAGYFLGPWTGENGDLETSEDAPSASSESQGGKNKEARKKPMNLEIQLEEGILLVGRKLRGRCRLDLKSRQFGRAAKAQCRIVTG